MAEDGSRFMGTARRTAIRPSTPCLGAQVVRVRVRIRASVRVRVTHSHPALDALPAQVEEGCHPLRDDLCEDGGVERPPHLTPARERELELGEAIDVRGPLLRERTPGGCVEIARVTRGRSQGESR